MNRLVSGAACVALTLLVSLPALPAHAAPVTLSVPNPDPRPGQAIAFSGDGDDCPADASGAPGTFVATLTYRSPTADSVVVTARGNVAADGTFASTVTMPENAAAEAPSSIVASATCAGVATASNTVNLAVLYHPGTMTLSAATVAAGGQVTVTAAGCYGGEFIVIYGPAGDAPTTYEEGTSGTPAADRGIATTLTIAAAQAAGAYDVYVLCPGTQYAKLPLTITAGATPSPSAFPVPPLTSVEPATPVTTTTLGGGFAGTGTNSNVGGGVAGNGSSTPVATAPTAVRGEASFTG